MATKLLDLLPITALNSGGPQNLYRMLTKRLSCLHFFDRCEKISAKFINFLISRKSFSLSIHLGNHFWEGVIGLVCQEK